MNEKTEEVNKNNDKYDVIAEDLVLNLLKSHGHEFVMKANSSVNPDWDLVKFKQSETNKELDFFERHLYQVKGHNFSASSHTINADFSKLIADGNVEFLFLVIFKDEGEPEVYRFRLKDEVKEKGEGKELFDSNGCILYSKEGKKSRKNKKRTITLNCFYNKKYEVYRNQHLNKGD